MADSKKYNGSTWEHSLRKLTTATEAVENPLYSDGTAITAYTLKGNEEHTGTPSSQNPVMPNGVGERTENKFDYSDLEDGTLNNGEPIPYTGHKRTAHFIKVETSTTYRLSNLSDSERVSYYDSTKTYISNALINNVFTTPSNCEYVKFSGAATGWTQTTMLTKGSTAPSEFIPFGYKIPISNGQQTIDIYIGDLPLLKSLDGTVVDEISNGILTRRVDSDGSVLPTPTTTQITMPSIPTTDGANSITVDTTVQPSEFTATWTGWHDASVKEWDGSDWQ